MHSLITSYLLQSKECFLPGIGLLKIIHTPASTDTANNAILPPFEQVIFKDGSGAGSSGLVKYIAERKDIEQKEAGDTLIHFCNEWIERMNAGEKLTFETVGTLEKGHNGKIIFTRSRNENFLQPIAVTTAYRKEETPAEITEEIIAEEEPVTIEEATYNEEVVIERSYWGLWALILLAIGLVMLFYHFKDKPLTGSSIGNQEQFTIDSATAKYHK
jgi:hypothetical protein